MQSKSSCQSKNTALGSSDGDGGRHKSRTYKCATDTTTNSSYVLQIQKKKTSAIFEDTIVLHPTRRASCTAVFLYRMLKEWPALICILLTYFDIFLF